MCTETDSDPCLGTGPCAENGYSSHLGTGINVDISLQYNSSSTVDTDQSKENPSGLESERIFVSQFVNET